jgi:hypothetical protein
VSKTLRPQARSVLVLTGLMAGLLSGCGVAGTGFHPGVAAEVGDDTISVSKVNQVASDYCVAIEGQLADNNQVLPQRYLRGGIAGQLVLVSAAEQLAAEYDVEPGVQYDQKVAELQSGTAELSEGQQEAVIEIESSSAYITGIQEAVGEQLLRAKGAADPTIEKARARGQRVFNTWLADHDVAIDPQFGVEIKGGQAVPTDTSLSYAVGDTAKNGQADSPDQEYAASLPDSHRCG